jgi:hypothetical protein
MFKFTITSAALALFAGSFIAQAATIDFSTALPLGHQGQWVTVGGVTASAWDVSKTNNAVWIDDGVILNNRNEGPTELGLGVCLSSNCPTTGNGNINEIDNNGNIFEVIRLAFSAPTLVSSIGLSSLDSGLKDGFAIFGSNTATPTISSLTAIAQGTNTSVGGIVEPSIPVNQTFQYFFVTSKNRGATDSGSDFLLASVTTPTPEPYTSGMLGLGLLAIGAGLRLRISNQRNADSK